MKITLRNTTEITEINGIPARIWERKTDKGVPVIAFITRIAVNDQQDLAEFEKDLAECAPPSAEARSFPRAMQIS